MDLKEIVSGREGSLLTVPCPFSSGVVPLGRTAGLGLCSSSTLCSTSRTI